MTCGVTCRTGIRAMATMRVQKPSVFLPHEEAISSPEPVQLRLSDDDSFVELLVEHHIRKRSTTL